VRDDAKPALQSRTRHESALFLERFINDAAEYSWVPISSDAAKFRDQLRELVSWGEFIKTFCVVSSQMRSSPRR